MEATQATVITRKLAMAWITQAQRTSWPNRLSAVRGFAQHLSQFEPGTETTPAGIFPSPRRPRPYIYTEEEIERLLDATLHWGMARASTPGPIIASSACSRPRACAWARRLASGALMSISRPGC